MFGAVCDDCSSVLVDINISECMFASHRGSSINRRCSQTCAKIFGVSNSNFGEEKSCNGSS